MSEPEEIKTPEGELTPAAGPNAGPQAPESNAAESRDAAVYAEAENPAAHVASEKPPTEAQPQAPEVVSEDEMEDGEAVLAGSRRRTRRAFLAAGVSAAAGYGFYHWIGASRREGDPARSAAQGASCQCRDLSARSFRSGRLRPPIRCGARRTCG